MANESSPPPPPEPLPQSSRLGLAFFGIYVLLYVGFIALAVAGPAPMRTPVFGLNAALVYGTALIVGAIALAWLYEVVISRSEGRK